MRAERLLVVFMTSILSTTAVAQEARQRVYIVSSALEPELEAVAARVGSAARSALRSVEGADWATADQRFLGYPPGLIETLATARVRLEEGRQAYLDLELDQAAELLTESIRLFDEAQAALEDETDLGSALLYLGASHEFAGNSRAARSTFERLHRQMPHIVPDPAEFPPAVVERYESSAPRRMDGALHVESDPPGSVAYVDFVPRGLTGLTIEGLARGEHTVRITRPGATPYIEQVQVDRDQAEVAAFLVEAEGNEGLSDVVDAITGHELREANGAVGELGQRLDLDKIGVIRVSYGDTPATVKLEMVIFDVASGRRVLRGDVQAPRALGELEPIVRQAVTSGVENILRPTGGANDDERIIGIDGDPIGPPPVAQEDTAPLYTKWWLWTAVGVVLVAGVVVIAVTAGGGSDLGQNPNGEVVFEF